MAVMASALSGLVAGPVCEPGQPEYDEEVAGFNAAVVHRPEVVVGASSTADVVEAVRFARVRGWRVAVHSTGHGAHLPVEAGLLVTTRRIDRVQIDAAAREATAGAGARWGAVVAAAAPLGLAPIAGSSPTPTACSAEPRAAFRCEFRNFRPARRGEIREQIRISRTGNSAGP